ncbi:MAG: hypothetical protein K0Q79_1728 [Flavipsychrobacter sp.]|jgi:hypothetical protein|nr:hypothetical protein [Flavipsychrobacter sp.]
MKGRKDTVYLIDPVTGQAISKIIDVEQATLMNGKKIYEIAELIAPPLSDNVSGPFEEYLLKNLVNDPLLLRNDDGIIRVELYDFVVDEQGKVVYWSDDGMKYLAKDKTTRHLAGGLVEKYIVNYPAFKPFELNGVKVPVRLNVLLLRYSIVLKDHKASYTRGNLFSGRR